MQRIYTYPARVEGGNRRKIHETGTYRGGKPRRNGGPILFSDVTTLVFVGSKLRPNLRGLTYREPKRREMKDGFAASMDCGHQSDIRFVRRLAMI